MNLDDQSTLHMAEPSAAVEHIAPKPASKKPSERLSMADFFEELAASIPEEEVAHLPKDASARVDEFLYGKS